MPAEPELWFSDKGVLPKRDVPSCGICGAERKLEFQLLPQLIHLKKTHHDYGTVMFYTCSASCTDKFNKKGEDISGKAYREEYVYVQHEENTHMERPWEVKVDSKEKPTKGEEIVS